MREQAEEAAEYRRVQNLLKETEVAFLASEISVAQAEQARISEQISVTRKLISAETFRLEALEKRSQELGQEVAELDKSIDEEHSKEQREHSATAQSTSDIQLFQAKMEALAHQESANSADRLAIVVRLEEAEHELERRQEDLDQEQERAREIREAALGHGQETRALAAKLDKAERLLKQAQKKEEQRLRRQAERAHQLERRSRARRELDALEAALPKIHVDASGAKAAADELGAKLDGLKANTRTLVGQELALKAEEDTEAASLRSALSERAALTGRRQGIEETIDGLEGMSQGPRAVLQAAADKKLSGSFVSVGQAVQAAKEHALAIETALGGAVNDLIVESEQDAQRGIEFLKANRAGRATFQPLTLMRPQPAGPELRDVAQSRGVIGLAAHLVSYDAHLKPAIYSLLGRVLVVDTLPTALGLAKTRLVQDRDLGRGGGPQQWRGHGRRAVSPRLWATPKKGGSGPVRNSNHVSF